MQLFGKPKPLIDDASQQRVVEEIRTAEQRTTGEIRVYVESHCAYMDAMDRAQELFLSLGMNRTERRNAVLLYLAVKDRQFAIFGDEAIFNQAGGPAFWQGAAAVLRAHLSRHEFGEGIGSCVRTLGEALAAHFPYDPAVDKNELPDEIVFGK